MLRRRLTGADEDHDDEFAQQLHNTDPGSWKPMVMEMYFLTVTTLIIG